MESMFRKVVEQIFGNWTALKLAVEHSMGGCNSKQVALDTIDYIVQYCMNESELEIEDIEDTLDDIMDQEFNTICEDDSIKEISCLLLKFRSILKSGNIVQYEHEYNNLPNNNNWLLTNQDIREDKLPETSLSMSDEGMEKNSEWIQVKSKRKR